jgi:hypothetical protein
VRHLVRQVELYRERGPRPRTPDWLQTFVARAAEAFEPFSGVARVGYEAVYSEESRWEVSLFLGENESSVALDDECRAIPVNFRFKLDHLRDCFESINRLDWNVFPGSKSLFDDGSDLSFILVEGAVTGNAIKLQVHATAPDAAGPALRYHSSGDVELL